MRPFQKLEGIIRHLQGSFRGSVSKISSQPLLPHQRDKKKMYGLNCFRRKDRVGLYTYQLPKNEKKKHGI